MTQINHMRDINHLYFAITVCDVPHFDVQYDVTALRNFFKGGTTHS